MEKFIRDVSGFRRGHSRICYGIQFLAPIGAQGVKDLKERPQRETSKRNLKEINPNLKERAQQRAHKSSQEIKREMHC